MVMYFLIALLEGCGYMARVSVVLDPIFKKVGLSGKSVIPFVITVGYAVPGIMATRTIRNERERRATAMLAPFMPCGAKIPVIALFAGAFFDDAGWVSTVAYLSGILLIFLGALLVNRIAGYKARKSFFLIELPGYKLPSVKRAFLSMCSRGWAYMMFNLYTPPCFAAIGAMNSEIKSKKWLFAGIGLQLGIGYTVGFGVYQIGTLVTTGAFGAGFLPGLVAVSAFLALLVWLCLRAGRNITRDYALGGVKA